MSHPAPKKCATCGKPAKVFASFVCGGKIITEAWCQTHAHGEGLDNTQGYALMEAQAAQDGHRRDTTLRCPTCDCSQRDFERQGRFGCGACYKTFAGILPPLLNRMHRGVAHRGKIPLRGADSAIVRHRLALLQTELHNAVRAEQFEGAAQTRNAIEALNAKLSATGLPLGLMQTPKPLPPSQ